MVEQVEYRSCVRANTQGQHHVSKLADRGIGQDAFDVGHDQGHARGNDERDQADGRDEQALQAYAKVAAALPDHVDLQANLGIVLSNLGRAAEAEQALCIGWH